MGFRENLKSELSYKGILVKELAARTGISRNTIENYLNAREHTPTADGAVKIAQALGVTVEYLVTGEELPPMKTSLGPEIQDLIRKYKLLQKEDREIILAIMQLLMNRGK